MFHKAGFVLFLIVTILAISVYPNGVKAAPIECPATALVPCDPDAVMAFFGHVYLVHAIVGEIDLAAAYRDLSAGGFTAADIVRATEVGGTKIMFRTRSGQTLVAAVDTLYRPFNAETVNKIFGKMKAMPFTQAAAQLNSLVACISLMEAAYGKPDNWSGTGKWWDKAKQLAQRRYRSNVPHTRNQPQKGIKKFELNQVAVQRGYAWADVTLPQLDERDVAILIGIGAVVIVGYVVFTGGLGGLTVLPVLAVAAY
jgi:hypothetical protein